MRHFLMLLLVVTCTACVSKKNLGSKENPIKISLTPGKDFSVLMESGNRIKAHLENELNLSFEVNVPANYIAVIEALGSKRADISILNTMGYLMAHERYGAEAIFTLTDQRTR